MSGLSVHAQITSFVFDMFPEGDPEHGTWALEVGYAGEGWWRICRPGGGRWNPNLGRDETWGDRPCEGDAPGGGWYTPSEADWDAFRAVYRWDDPDEAKAFVIGYLPRYVVNGRTADEWAVERERRAASEGGTETQP